MTPTIAKAVAASKNVVVFIDRASVKSPWVTYEVAKARGTHSRNRCTIPVLLEETDLSVQKILLSDINYVNLANANTITFEYQRLLARLGIRGSYRVPRLFLLHRRQFQAPQPTTVAVTSNSKVVLEITFTKPGVDASPLSIKRLLISLQELVEIGEVRILDVKSGSVILRLAFSVEDAARVFNAMRDDKLRALGVSGVLFVGYAESPATEASARQYTDDKLRVIQPRRAPSVPAELIHRLSKQRYVGRAIVRKMVRLLLREIASELERGNKIVLQEFGVFEVVDRARRIVRNPKSGETIEVPARRIVRFKPGRLLREQVGLWSSAEGAIQEDQEDEFWR
jgi:DNA-binding protein HU-beta